MKKVILLMIIACFMMMTGKAQLANTKWKGEMGIRQGPGQPLENDEVIWDFKPDTVVLHFTEGGEDEVMTYGIENNIMTIKKVSGGSQCEAGSTGKYKFSLKANQFFITLLEDSCQGRSGIDFSKPFMRVD
jgi:hypothetical protein